MIMKRDVIGIYVPNICIFAETDIDKYIPSTNAFHEYDTDKREWRKLWNTISLRPWRA